MTRAKPAHEKPLHWVASAKRDLLGFDAAVIDDIGYALGVVQLGGTPSAAKAWKGEGAGVMQIDEDHRGDTYRAVYTVRFAQAIYVLHCFQKKSPSGIKTAKTDVELIRARLKLAQSDYEAHYEKD